MSNEPPRGFRLVLVGGGHANLLVLKDVGRWLLERRKLDFDREQDVQILLISDQPFSCYSGMLPGAVAGLVSPTEALFDLQKVCTTFGAQFLCASLRALHADEQRIEVQEHGTHTLLSVSFDILLLNIGSTVSRVPFEGGLPSHVIPTRPILQLLPRLRARELAIVQAKRPEDTVSIVVVGAGFAGLELAWCLRSRYRHGRSAAGKSFPSSVRITLVNSEERLSVEQSSGFQLHAAQVCREQEITVMNGKRVDAITNDDDNNPNNDDDDSSSRGGTVVLDCGRRLPSDLTIWATGPKAIDFAARPPVPTDDRDYLRVLSTLQLASHPNIFAAGDCISFPSARPISKSGVYSVREAAVLTENLLACLRASLSSSSSSSSTQPLHQRIPTQQLRSYEPQASHLALLCIGTGEAVCRWKNTSCRGRPLWRLKLWIDRRFVRSFDRAEGSSIGSSPWALILSFLPLLLFVAFLYFSGAWSL